MIRTAVNRGLIYSAGTPLACTIAVEQTGPMQLTVRAGELVWTDGSRYVLAADQVLDLASDAAETKLYRVELGSLAGTVDVLCRSRIDTYPAAPDGWQRVQTLIVADGATSRNWEFAIPSGTTDLSGIDLYVFAVRQGRYERDSDGEWWIKPDNTREAVG